MIRRLLTLPSVQIGLCLALFALLAWRMGPFAGVIAAPLLGAAIARPMMSLLANLRHKAREHTWLPVHGQHYVYKGATLRVLEDDEHRRWVPVADVRKVVGLTASDRALTATYAQRCEPIGRAGLHLRDDALIEHLGKENNPAALRFRTWAERNIALPGQRVRQNLGIRDD